MSALMADWKKKRARDDEQLHDQLRAAILAETVEVHTDQRMLDFQGSPVHSPWDHLVPLMGLMFLALGILLFGGVAIGIVAMTMGVFAHVYGVKYLVAWRIRQRATAYLLESTAHWQQLWHLGGIVIVIKGTSDYCMAPKGDWRKFVRRNLPDESEGTAEEEEETAPSAAPPVMEEEARPWNGDTVLPPELEPEPTAPRGPVQEILPP